MYCAIDETEESPSSEDEPLPGAAAALSALSDLTLPLSALGEWKTRKSSTCVWRRGNM